MATRAEHIYPYAGENGKGKVAQMAGTPEARKAWWHLRGPMLGAYVLLIATGFLVTPQGPETYAWRVVTVTLALTCVVGSVASYVVAVRGHVEPRLIRVETLEVTGLRLMSIFQLAYGGWVWGIGGSLDRVLIHLLIGLLVLGALQTMTWRKRAGNG